MGQNRGRSATITAIEGEVMKCRVECYDACGGCAARRVCGGDDSGKELTLLCDNENYRVGDTIVVEVSSGMGLRAVILAYIVPIVLIIGVLLGGNALGLSELMVGVGALGVVAIYYLVVKIFGIGSSVSISIVDNKEK